VWAVGGPTDVSMSILTVLCTNCVLCTVYCIVLCTVLYCIVDNRPPRLSVSCGWSGDDVIMTSAAAVSDAVLTWKQPVTSRYSRWWQLANKLTTPRQRSHTVTQGHARSFKVVLKSGLDPCLVKTSGRMTVVSVVYCCSYFAATMWCEFFEFHVNQCTPTTNWIHYNLSTYRLQQRDTDSVESTHTTCC